MLRALPALLLTAVASAQTSPAGEFHVSYTGRLLGYFRSPDIAEVKPVAGGYVPVSPETCPDLDTRGSAAAQSMRRQLALQPANTVLLGMGDNFAPDLFGRAFRIQGTTELVPKDTVYWSRAKEKWIDATGKESAPPEDQEDELGGRSEVLTDNAGCAIKQLGYRAIVAGKHDFYYGPERLRQLARFLTKLAGEEERKGWRPNPKQEATGKQFAQAMQCPDCGRVDLLGANLAILAARPNAPPPVPDYLKKLDYDVEAPGISVDLPAVVLPWLRTVRVSGGRRFYLRNPKRIVVGDEFPNEEKVSATAGESSFTIAGETVDVEAAVTAVQLCRGAGSNPDAIEPPEKCQKLGIPKLAALAGRAPSTGFTVSLPAGFMLVPGGNYAVCLGLEQGPRRFCTRFYVHHPYLQYPFKPDLADPARHETFLYSDTPAPYVVLKDRNLAIFGAVDPDMKESVGPSNFTWIGPEGQRSSETTVVFADPAASLTQLLDLCELDPSCRIANKILLAQMPAGQAVLLNARLGGRFHLVIAQTDSRHASGRETRVVTVATPGAAPPFLAVPRNMYELGQPGQIDVRLQTAHVVQKRDDPSVWLQTQEFFSQTMRVKQPKPNDDLAAKLANYARDRAWDKMTGSDPASTWTITARFQRTVLDIMLGRFQADVSILQRRDLFQPAEEIRRGSDVTDTQSVLDRIIWKGDFVSRVPITGAALKAVAAKSKAFAAQDRDARNASLEPGRDLIFLGMVEDRARRQWLIRGEPVEDGRLYSAVVSDYLAFGEAGYTEFRKPAVPPADPLGSLDAVWPLSPMVCRALAGDPCRQERYDAGNFLDSSSLKPPSSDRGLTPLRRLGLWIDTSRKEAKAGPLSKSTTPASEKRAQNQPHWGLALERADFAFLDYNNNFASEDALAASFAGVPNSQVQAPNSSNLNVGYRLRGLRSSGWGDVYALGEGSYNRVFTRRSAGRVQDQRANTVALEGGINPRVWPRFKQIPDLKALVAVRYQSQFAQPILAFALKDGTIRREIERAAAISSRFGLRYQSRRSWFEGGYQAGAALNTPVSYKFGSQEACLATNVGSETTLSTCLGKLSNGDLTVTYRPSLFQHGFFLAYRVAVPLPFGEERYYVQENRGDFYFTRDADTPIDTRLFDTWSHSLVLPIRGNFSLVPRLDFFFFANKRLATGRWFAARQASMGLQYRFEWREGLPWGKALKYPNPVR